MIERRPLWPPWPPPLLSRTMPNGRSISSWTTRMWSSSILWNARRALHREARQVHELHRLEQHGALAAALGRDRRRGRLAAELARTPRRQPVLARELVDDRKPMLWRLRSYFAPGLPSPTTSQHAPRRDYFLARLRRRGRGRLAAPGAALPAGQPRPWRPSRPRPEPPPQPQPEPRPRPGPRPRPAAATFSSSGAAQVTTARSRPVTAVTPVGSAIAADVDDVADLERRDVDRELDRDVARLRANLEVAQHDAELAAVDRALRLADELERHLGADFLVRIDRDQVDVRDVAADRIDLVVLDQRVQRARLRAALDRQVDDGVVLADRVERGAQRLDVDDDRQRLDAAIGRGAVADAREPCPARAACASGTLATGRCEA